MRKGLLERCRPDSIREFRAAARQRFNEGLMLATHGYRTGAIYLFGYTAEMILKAAYFSRKLADTDEIRWKEEILPAIRMGPGLSIRWPPQGQGHNVRAWAELLIIERNTSPVPLNASLDPGILTHGQRIEQHWRETLRYHRNRASRQELRQVRESTEWFLVNSPLL